MSSVAAPSSYQAALQSILRRQRGLFSNLLLFVGLYQPVMLVALLWQRGDGLDPALLALALARTALAWGCMVAVYWRRMYRQAAAVFVVGQLGLTFLVYWRWGLDSQSAYQLLQLLPVLLAGQVLGRRQLWAAAVCLCLCVGAGAVHDLAAGRGADLVMVPLLHRTIGVLVVAVVLDSALGQLRRSLLAAHRQSSAASAARARLEREIQEKEEAIEQLVHMRRVEAVGQMASGAAHDFSHLLALVQAHVRQALACTDPEQLRSALQSVEATLRRAQAASRRLVDFSRAGSAGAEVFDMGEALLAMEPLLRQMMGPGVVVVILADPGADYRVRFDRQQLELIALNLASNAGAAMGGRGRFMLELEVAGGDDGQAGQVVLRASDTGVGMSEEVQACCFDPFFTTKPAGSGTGLGLPMARRLLEESGGSIRVRSVPGQGSCFSVVLPQYAEATAGHGPAVVA